MNSGVFRNSVRLILAWLILSILGVAVGKQVVSSLLPFFSDIISAMSTSYTHALTMTHSNGISNVKITATLVQPIRATGGSVLVAGNTFSALIHTWHILVPVVIIFSLLLAWPVKILRQRAQLLLIAIPVSLFVLAFTIPALLAGHIERQLFTLLEKAGGKPDIPFILDWVIFVEMGGLWLFPIAGAIICVLLSTEIDIFYDSVKKAGLKSTPLSKRTKYRQKINRRYESKQLQNWR